MKAFDGNGWAVLLGLAASFFLPLVFTGSFLLSAAAFFLTLFLVVRYS